MDPEDDKPTTWTTSEGSRPSPRTGSAGEGEGRRPEAVAGGVAGPESPAPPSRPGERDENPRRSFWAAMPKRSVTRVLILLAALFGIIYLREQTSSIAGCMSNAFRAPAPASTENAARARIELRIDAFRESLR